MWTGWSWTCAILNTVFSNYYLTPILFFFKQILDLTSVRHFIRYCSYTVGMHNLSAPLYPSHPVLSPHSLVVFIHRLFTPQLHNAKHLYSCSHVMYMKLVSGLINSKIMIKLQVAEWNTTLIILCKHFNDYFGAYTFENICLPQTATWVK